MFTAFTPCQHVMIHISFFYYQDACDRVCFLCCRASLLVDTSMAWIKVIKRVATTTYIVLRSIFASALAGVTPVHGMGMHHRDRVASICRPPFLVHFKLREDVLGNLPSVDTS